MKKTITAFCLTAIAQVVLAQTGIEAYRQGDMAAAGNLLQAQSNPSAAEQYYLARLYLQGYGVLKSDALALKLMMDAAKHGDTRAQLWLGHYCLNHDKAPEQALIWFKQAAAAAGDLNAQIYCAGAYLFGVGTPINLDSATKYLISAAKADNSLAQSTLADIFLQSHASANRKLGLIWLRKAVDQGDPKAQSKMAALYLKGDGVDKDLNQAKQLAELAHAKNYTPVLSVLSEIEAKLGHTQEANDYAVQASSQDYAKIAQELPPQQSAEYLMVKWLSYGKQGLFKESDYQLAGILDDWSNLEALQNNRYNPLPSMPKFEQSQLFHTTFTLLDPRDLKLSEYYTLILSTMAHLPKEELIFPVYPTKLKAQEASEQTLNANLIAERPGFDYLVKRASDAHFGIDYHQLFEQLLTQADLGDSIAQFDLAQLYQQGLGTEKSLSQALKYYHLAAAQNDLPAEYQLGILYLLGDKDLEPNYQLGMEWLTDAAFKGNQYAQYALARIYEQGYHDIAGHLVVEANPSQSKAMFQLASSQAYGPAQYRLAEIMTRESPKDRSIAGLKHYRKTIKKLYQGAMDSGIAAAKFPWAFYVLMDADSKLYAKAFEAVRLAALNGSHDAEFLLGLMYDRGIASEVNHQQALGWFYKAGQHPLALFVLGSYALEGKASEINHEQALKDLQESSAKGFPEALYNLAIYNQQQGKPFIEDLEKASAAGSAHAALALADYHIATRDDSKKMQEARNLYETFAKEGDKLSQLKLAYLYEQGIGGSQDYQQALSWYGTAAQRGYPEAQYLLGRMYQLGLSGQGPNYKLAREWYAAAAKANYAPAAVAYGFIDEVVDDNYLHAQVEYQQALALNDPQAGYNLGLIYEMGKKQPINFSQAETLYLDAAKAGQVDAMVRLGVLYGAEKEFKKAFFWLGRAQILGNADANYQLGQIYENQLGKFAEKDKAIQYYEFAAKKNHAEALLALARMYQQGKTVDKNPVESARYYKELAKQNNPEAEYQIALVCLSGDLSGCTLQEGKQWLQKAQDHGVSAAAKLLRLYTAKSQENVSYIESVRLNNG